MIDRAVQRGGGQNLASHFLKEWENEQITIAEIRGAVAQDLHGAFKEWWLASKATNASQYLFTVAVNPDPKQPEWSRDQYQEFIDCMEKTLGLEDQPRAILFHTKYGREHAHVTWSRTYSETVIDRNGHEITKFKAKQMDFYKDKIMRTAIQFAKDIDYTLPQGYDDWQKGQFNDKSKNLTQADRAAEQQTGVTIKQHEAMLTDAWRQSDSAKAFAAALEQRGYILARGDRRNYVAVDRYGKVHSLSRRIDGVKTKDIKTRLSKIYPLPALPSVEQARETAAKCESALAEKTRKDFNAASDQAHHELQQAQDDRRDQLKEEQEEANKQHPTEYKLIELDRLSRNLDMLDAAERRALNDFLKRRALSIARSGDDDSAHALSASALAAARSTITALQKFDQTHPDTGAFQTELRNTYSAVGRLEGRQKYAGELRRIIFRAFQNAFGVNAHSAHDRYLLDVERLGIEQATRNLLENPRRYGRLQGWHLATFAQSKDRKEALAALEKAAREGRKSFYLDRKLETELDQLPALKTKLAQLKKRQRDMQQSPAEGRLYLQYLLAKAGNRLSKDDFTLLRNHEKFHVNEARRLMRDTPIREWTEHNLRRLLHPDARQISPPHNLPRENIDLREISNLEMRRFLNRQFRALRQRQEAELDTLDRNYKRETQFILQRKNSFFGRTIGFLAALPGLRHALDRHRIPDMVELEQNHQNKRLILRQIHEMQDKPFAEKYRNLKRREREQREIGLKRALKGEFAKEAMTLEERRENRLKNFKHNVDEATRAKRNRRPGDDDRRRRRRRGGYSYDRDHDDGD